MRIYATFYEAATSTRSAELGLAYVEDVGKQCPEDYKGEYEDNRTNHEDVLGIAITHSAAQLSVGKTSHASSKKQRK